jgi:hypothetical protein
MDIGKAIGFVFEDQDWISKVLIGALITFLSFLILPAFLLFGYSLEITKRVLRGDPQPLPPWTELGDLFVKGVMVVIIGIVYALPIIIINVCATPIWIIADNSRNVGTAETLSGLASFGVGCLSFLWAIVMSIVLPAALARFADTGELRDAFQFGDILRFVQDNLGTYIVVFLVIWVASLIAGVIGAVACGIGLFFTQPILYMFMGHLYGQAYLKAQGEVTL